MAKNLSPLFVIFQSWYSAMFLKLFCHFLNTLFRPKKKTIRARVGPVVYSAISIPILPYYATQGVALGRLNWTFESCFDHGKSG